MRRKSCRKISSPFVHFLTLSYRELLEPFDEESCL